MLRASRAQDLADFASASKNQERQAIARYIDRFPDTIIASADRTSIKNKLQSNNQEQVRQALQELEHKIGQAHLGGGTADFNTINEANAFFAHLQ